MPYIRPEDLVAKIVAQEFPTLPENKNKQKNYHDSYKVHSPSKVIGAFNSHSLILINGLLIPLIIKRFCGSLSLWFENRYRVF